MPLGPFNILAQPKDTDVCPACGGLALVTMSNGKWRCVAVDNVIVGAPKVLVCDARGKRVDGDLLVSQGSNNLWQLLL